MDFYVNPTTTINNFDFVDDQIVEVMKFGEPQPYKRFKGTIQGIKVKGLVCLNDDQIYQLESDE